MGVSSEVFATFMGVSVRTLPHWEQGQREPNASARTLLLIADKQQPTFYIEEKVRGMSDLF